MNVTIVTPFRDSAPLLAEYRQRIAALDWPHDNLRAVFVEGDSVDDTRLQLQMWCVADRRFRQVACDTGKPRYGSVVNPVRFEILARVFNTGLDAVDYHWTDAVLFVPCDIVYQPDLLKRLAAHQVDAVAPMVWMGNAFYDIWAFQRNGVNFCGMTKDNAAVMHGLLELDTIGGTMLIDADVLRAGVRYSLTDVDRGFSRDAKRLGFSLYADTETHVEHPLR